MKNTKLRILPLGGLGEVGKNMMVLEYADDIVVIDAGLMFPGEEIPGVDSVIPDISYLRERQQNLRGIIITHGHLDHIGALPYVISQLDIPIYAGKFSQELIFSELRQRGAKSKAKVNVVHAGSRITLGNFTIEFFPVCHSIPGSMGLIIHTPLGVIVHSGDFKLDYTPIIGEPTDLNRLAHLGTKGVLLLFSDSTYIELPGYTPSEFVVSDALDRIMSGAEGRIIIATFSSLVSRIQQVIDIATKHNRRLFITGRSMEEIAKVAVKTGYLTIPSGVLCHFDELGGLPHNQVVVLATGTQGEPTSALVRIANQEHKQIQIIPGDTVVISATLIPGNETLVNRTIDSLFRQGANVIYDKLTPVHVHGHGSQEELKLLLNLVKPKFFIPIHGEYRHLSLHARLAHSLGMPTDNTFVLEDGDILELGQDAGQVTDKIHLNRVYVSGSVTGKLDNAVLDDLKSLSRDGIVIATVAIDAKSHEVVESPRIIMRGFVDAAESQALMQKSQNVVIAALNQDRRHLLTRKTSSHMERSNIEAKIIDSLTKFLYEQTHRHPTIIPVIVEV
jgi:ribonuclease J